jgi:Tfp pilus assembly protein PilF
MMWKQNKLRVCLVIILLMGRQLSATAQNTEPVADLIKQGTALHNEHKYAEAIDKFGMALKAEPENGYVNYKIAFSLYAAKRAKEAVPYLEKAVKTSSAPISVAAYVLLAGIYDEDNQSAKAIAAYNEAIKIDPGYPQVYYNLGLAYSRNKQYAEAETAAIGAIKRDPKHAGSHRLYALVAFHQNKRVNALLGFCSFLLLELGGQRATEAYGNMQHILQGGTLAGDKNNVIKDDKETSTLNNGIALSVTSAKLKKLTSVALLEYQLKSIFMFAGELSQKKTDKSFYDHFFATYFYKLAQSNNMLAFAHHVSAAASLQENAKWAIDHPEQVVALNEWLKNTERVF